MELQKDNNGFEDDFEIIDKPSEQTKEDKILEKEMKKKKKNDINALKNVSDKLLSELKEGDEQEEEGFWVNFKRKLSNTKNSMKYNIINFNSILNIKHLTKIQIFDKSYNLQLPDDIKKFEEDINFIIWKTYRSNFDSISTTHKNYISDCGWGCMIRVSQMLLSQALFRIKVNDYIREVKPEVSFDRKYGILIMTILLFMDNGIKLEEIKENLDFKNYIDDFKNIKEFLTSDEYNNKKIVPPFSIQNICNVGALYDKIAGKFYSEISVINILEEIVNSINLSINLQINTFQEGVIYEKNIIENCFKKVYWKCNCGDVETKETMGSNKQNEQNTNNTKNHEILICCCNQKNIKDKEYNITKEKIIMREIIIINNQKYYLKKRGIIFLVFRLGLDEISPIYYSQVLRLFDIYQNLGIMGGKENNAFYYIGKGSNDSVVYVDPHYNQESIKSVKELIVNYGYRSYNTSEYLYSMPINSIHPSFSFGLFFSSLHEYVTLMKDLVNFSNEFQNPIMKVKYSEDIPNVELYDNTKEDDF